jgi:lysyl-tRNA synthetase class 2
MHSFDEEWLAKLSALRERGVEPYPTGLRVSHTAGELRSLFGAVPPDHRETEGEGADVQVGGRVMFRNRMGKALFLRIQDRSGVIQVYLRRDEIGDETFSLFNGLDIGDFVWARGFVMKTRTGELTVQAREAKLASKILTPFPDRWHGVHDVELRSRRRYVDLFMSEETRSTFRARSDIVRHLRDFLHARDFVEVETPMLQVVAGGAVARPFVTHHNALDMELYLRIAPELYLKRLVVGGIERVFEINRSFRNEGISVRHNPEFTMLELYQAWATHEDFMTLTEEMLGGLVEQVCGARRIPYGERTVDFTAPFRRAAMDELVAEATGLTRDTLQDVAQMEAFWRTHHPAEAGEVLPTTRGGWWEWLFDAYVQDGIVDPVFVTGFPLEISPLSRRSDADPTRVDRFELVVCGRELVNAFSELADPVEQAERFVEQARARAAGDPESMPFDHDYIRALGYAMPPTAGLGMGIDRLCMLLTNKPSIREVILFPTLRPEQSPEAT